MPFFGLYVFRELTAAWLVSIAWIRVSCICLGVSSIDHKCTDGDQQYANWVSVAWYVATTIYTMINLDMFCCLMVLLSTITTYQHQTLQYLYQYFACFVAFCWSIISNGAVLWCWSRYHWKTTFYRLLKKGHSIND